LTRHAACLLCTVQQGRVIDPSTHLALQARKLLQKTKKASPTVSYEEAAACSDTPSDANSAVDSEVRADRGVVRWLLLSPCRLTDTRLACCALVRILPWPKHHKLTP